MNKRIQLQEKLENILGSRKVFFQPPETVKLSYPCIIYELSRIDTVYADDAKYKTDRGYTVTLIHNNPDNDLVDKILEMDFCSFDRTFVANNLYHYVFTLFY